jgi:hypothetical protein
MRPTKAKRTRRAPAPPVPVFPNGAEWDALPPGARAQPAIWRRPDDTALLSSGAEVTMCDRDVPCDLEGAIEQEANWRLLDILRAGRFPSAEDFERCATRPPMSGERLLNLVVALGALSGRKWRRVEAARKRAQRAHMQSIAAAPRVRRKKWGSNVQAVAERFYEKAMTAYRSDPARFWRWREFAPRCIACILDEPGEHVTEDQLRRWILPARSVPRPG